MVGGGGSAGIVQLSVGTVAASSWWGSGSSTLRDVAGVGGTDIAWGLVELVLGVELSTHRGAAGSGDGWLGLVVPWRMVISC